MPGRLHRISLNKGIMYSFAFGGFAALNVTTGKIMIMKDFSPFLLLFFRVSVHLVALVKFPTWSTESISYGLTDLFIYVTGTTVGVTSWLAMNLSFRDLEVGDNTAIEMGAIVIFTTLFGYILLFEGIDRYDVVLLICDLVGISLVGKPNAIFGYNLQKQNGAELVGVGWAITSGCLFSLYSIAVKIMAKRGVLTPGMVQIFHGIAGLPLASIAAVFVGPWKVKYDVYDCLLVLVYQCACLGQTTFQALALETEDARSVAVSSTISCVLSYVAQLTIFQASVDWLAIPGSVCIVTVIFLEQRKQISEHACI